MQRAALVALPSLAERSAASRIDTVSDAALDAAKAREAFEAMTRRLAAPPSPEDATALDDYDRRLMGATVVQIRLNLALPVADVRAQLQAVRRAAESALLILEGGAGTSATRRLLAQRQMAAARDMVRDTRRAAGETTAK